MLFTLFLFNIFLNLVKDILYYFVISISVKKSSFRLLFVYRNWSLRVSHEPRSYVTAKTWQIVSYRLFARFTQKSVHIVVVGIKQRSSKSGCGKDNVRLLTSSPYSFSVYRSSSPISKLRDSRLTHVARFTQTSVLFVFMV